MPEPTLPVAAPRRATAHWQLWLLLIVLAALAVALLVPTLIGIYVGMQERAAKLHQLAVDHYQQALAYESENYNDLAIAELQIAVKFDPTYQPALDHLKALQAGPAKNGTAVSDGGNLTDQLFSKAQAAITNQQWNEAIDALEEIRSAAPTYRASEVKTLLIQAYLNGGKQSVAAGQIDQANARFEAVLGIDPSNADAQTLRDRVQLYLNGAQAKDSDWPTAASNFAKLYQQDPTFYDVKNQLLNALRQYGDAATKQEAYCVAAREYAEAAALDSGTDVATKLAQANASCKQAITAPTATPTLSGDVTPVAGSTPVASSGAFVASARIDTNTVCQGTGSVTGIVHDAQGAPLAGVRIRIYNDLDYHPAPFATDANGKYSIVLGINQGLFHLVVLDPDGTFASGVFNLNYPGGLANGCHWIVDWTKSP